MLVTIDASFRLASGTLAGLGCLPKGGNVFAAADHLDLRESKDAAFSWNGNANNLSFRLICQNSGHKAREKKNGKQISNHNEG
jgi:hypothetical protein